MKEERYYEEIPEEIRVAIKGFDSEPRQKIFTSLLRNGELSFSELKKKTGLSKPDLNFHLKKLINAMLVEHYYRHKIGNDRFSFYAVTHFGYNFINALIQSLTPSMPSVETTEVVSMDLKINILKATRKTVLVPASASGKRPQIIKLRARTARQKQ